MSEYMRACVFDFILQIEGQTNEEDRKENAKERELAKE